MDTCPRCGTPLNPRLVRNALSRLDNDTHICASCGTAEAMWQLTQRIDGKPTDLPPFDVPLFD